MARALTVFVWSADTLTGMTAPTAQQMEQWAQAAMTQATTGFFSNTYRFVGPSARITRTGLFVGTGERTTGAWLVENRSTTLSDSTKTGIKNFIAFMTRFHANEAGWPQNAAKFEAYNEAIHGTYESWDSGQAAQTLTRSSRSIITPPESAEGPRGLPAWLKGLGVAGAVIVGAWYFGKKRH